MSEISIRRHWYDGWFYAFFIDSRLNVFRDRIFRFVTAESCVLDIGCGTGGFTLQLSHRCAHVTGIDISQKQIQVAKKRLERNDITNVDFLHADASDLSGLTNRTYDCAIFSFVIHEMSHEKRLDVLNSVAKVASQLVILDYNTPHPFSFYGISTRIIELLAGRDHFTNFKDYLNRNGIDGIFREINMSSHLKLVNNKRIFRIDLVHTE
jgi:ubiquinone/menaquinone biosynthesis C-methylase UbiE